jgi:hypothetical protein
MRTHIIWLTAAMISMTSLPVTSDTPAYGQTSVDRLLVGVWAPTSSPWPGGFRFKFTEDGTVTMSFLFETGGKLLPFGCSGVFQAGQGVIKMRFTKMSAPNACDSADSYRLFRFPQDDRQLQLCEVLGQPPRCHDVWDSYKRLE